jgi:hypothetical protein
MAKFDGLGIGKDGRSMKIAKNLPPAPRLKRPALLSLEELEDILLQKRFFMDWFGAVEDAVFRAALQGKTVKHKLVYGRSVRQWKSPVLANRFFNQFEVPLRDRQKITLISPSQAEKLVKANKKELSLALKEVCFKPQGKLTLVSSDDKREAAFQNMESYFDDI